MLLFDKFTDNEKIKYTNADYCNLYRMFVIFARIVRLFDFLYIFKSFHVHDITALVLVLSETLCRHMGRST